MIPISIEEFAKLHIQSNKGEKLEDIISRLKEAVKDKKAGAKCPNCGEPIWAIGSAIVYYSCFTCLTGEADPSDDYEIDEVC